MLSDGMRKVVSEKIRQSYWALPYELRRTILRVMRSKDFYALQHLRLDVPVDPRAPTVKPFLENRCIFVHIPKAAGISVGYALFGRHTGNHLSVSDYQTVFSRKEFEAFFKFAIVRNPWDRLLSAYRFLKKGGRNEGDRRWAERHLAEFDDFQEFVMKWVSTENVRKGVHFKPQCDFIQVPGDDQLQIDYLGRFESLESDFQHICERLGVDAVLRHSNRSTQSNRDFRQQYDDRMIQIVADVYRKDIEVLGYDFDNAMVRNVRRCQ